MPTLKLESEARRAFRLEMLGRYLEDAKENLAACKERLADADAANPLTRERP